MLVWPFRRRAMPARTLEPQSAYARWAATYPPEPHNRLMEVEQDAVLGLLPDVSGLLALDAGCGSGRYLRALRERGARAIGIDLSAEMLSRARQLSSRLARADLRALPFDEMAIDVVVCALALGDFAEIDLALGEIARVLRPGGFVIYSVVHPIGESQGWTRTFTSSGRQWAIDGVWHSLDRHRAACAAADLTVMDWQEPAMGRTGGRAVLVVRAQRR